MEKMQIHQSYQIGNLPWWLSWSGRCILFMTDRLQRGKLEKINYIKGEKVLIVAWQTAVAPSSRTIWDLESNGEIVPVTKMYIQSLNSPWHVTVSQGNETYSSHTKIVSDSLSCPCLKKHTLLAKIDPSRTELVARLLNQLIKDVPWWETLVSITTTAQVHSKSYSINSCMQCKM